MVTPLIGSSGRLPRRGPGGSPHSGAAEKVLPRRHRVPTLHHARDPGGPQASSSWAKAPQRRRHRRAPDSSRNVTTRLLALFDPRKAHPPLGIAQFAHSRTLKNGALCCPPPDATWAPSSSCRLCFTNTYPWMIVPFRFLKKPLVSLASRVDLLWYQEHARTHTHKSRTLPRLFLFQTTRTPPMPVAD